ncbi:MAG: NAD(P)-dependent alcohol dehydrogenase, partial [Terracidiphilus sp.]
MALIQGLAVHAAGAELLPYRYDPGKLGPQEVEIAITHCGICHSDLHLISNDWGISQYPFIPGHEIVGSVAAVGDEVRSLEVDQRVGLGWQSNSCGECEWCSRGMENLCPKAEGTCVHRHGGYAERVRANARFVIQIPEALESECAAPLLCGGITVYNPLRTYGVNPSSRVGIVGIGGLGHIAIQFARVFGAEVTAFSTSAGKEEEVRALGAHRFVNSRESKALKEVAGSLDFILSTVNADQDWGTYVQALRPTGTLCFVGVPPSPVAVHAFPLISGLRSITGNPTGSPYRIREMLDVAARHGVKA